MKPTAVVVCPGRGTYNKGELGYLRRHHASKRSHLERFEAERRSQGQASLADLDGAGRFAMSRHGTGDNASALIFASSFLDAIDVFERFDVRAVTGNSMGWYTTLAVAGAVLPEAGFRVVNTMGRLMQESLIGGQVVYPIVGEDWRPDAAKRQFLLDRITEIDARPDCRLDVSIELGGMLVLAGDANGLDAFQASVPVVQERFPMRLANHAAFHSALQEPVARLGRDKLGHDLFGMCRLPMIDGRGCVWWPKSYDTADLRDYTLGHQVTKTYDFTAAIRVAARSFAPDVFVVLGPGDTMGGAVAQSLIAIDWEGIGDKAEFQARQKTDPVLFSMGRDQDRVTL